MKNILTKQMTNGDVCRIDEIPRLSFAEFSAAVTDSVKNGLRVIQFFAVEIDRRKAKLFAVLADNSSGKLFPASTEIVDEFPSLTPTCPQLQLFEREIFEQTGIIPAGHPWLKPVRVQGATEFFAFDGEETHEVGVGPVHAGVIEPGHFRFQCHGERILNLEISLGFQHRGIEKHLAGGPDNKTIHLMETAAGDTTVGHTTAYCRIMDSLKKQNPPKRVQAIQAIALELERLANHIGDLGALSGDVGYLPTNAYCGKLRGDVLNLTADICGNRFGRNLLVPGQLKHDITRAQADLLKGKLKTIIADSLEAIDLLWDNPSVLARFEHVGTLEKDIAEELGAVGPPARACGINNDVRHGFSTGIYAERKLPTAICDTGDVFARAFIRKTEIERSFKYIVELLENLPEGPCSYKSNQAPATESFTVSMVEGWRGEICHCAITDRNGKFLKYKIVDPSFHNWYVFSHTLRNVEISDFPLCNKSFNLSYCGFDL